MEEARRQPIFWRIRQESSKFGEDSGLFVFAQRLRLQEPGAASMLSLVSRSDAGSVCLLFPAPQERCGKHIGPNVQYSSTTSR